jgi:hypothetical protein
MPKGLKRVKGLKVLKGVKGLKGIKNLVVVLHRFVYSIICLLLIVTVLKPILVYKSKTG